jgi:protocatechuate 3,4-dioxygenase beta subunit
LPLDSEVWASRERRRREAFTDPDGRFEFKDVRPGATRLAVRSELYASHDSDHLVLAPDADNDAGEIVLELGARLFGRVVDARGAPVQGVRLYEPFDASDPSWRWREGATGRVLATSDGSGDFSIGPLAVGPWTLLAHDERYPDAVVRGATRTPGETASGIVVRLDESASISGVVRIAGGAGAPAPEMLSVLASYAGPRTRSPGEPDDDRRLARCTAHGIFEVTGLRAGEPYRVQVRWHRNSGDERGNEIGPARDVLAGDRDVVIELAAFTVLTFRPLDARTGAPLEDVDARLFDVQPDGRERGLVSTTSRAESGSWRETAAEVPPAGDLAVLFVEHDGHRPVRSQALPLARGAAVDLGELRLEPLGRLAVRVVDAATGQPIRGARVQVELQRGDDGSRSLQGLNAAQDTGRPQRVRSRETGGDGLTHVFASDGATGLACVTHPDWPSSPMVAVAFSSTPGAPVEFALVAGAAAEVLVRDTLGEAVPGAIVRARTVGLAGTDELRGASREERTDSEGFARFERLTPGPTNFQLLEDRVGWVPADERARAVSSADLAPDSVAQIELYAVARGRLYGRVLEARAPLAGARIELQPGSQRDVEKRRGERGPDVVAHSGPSGEYAIPRLGAGRWTITVTHASRISAFTREVQFSGRDEKLDLELPGCVLAGRVTDGKGHAVEGARVVLGRMRADERQKGQTVFTPLPAGRTPRSDADGMYELRGVPAGVELQIDVEHERFQDARSDSLRLAVDEVRRDVDFRLKPGATIEVEVLASDGGAPRARVSARRVADDRGKPAKGAPKTLTLDGRGRARFTGLAAGRYRVVVERKFAGSDSEPVRNVDVDAGKIAEVRFDVP